MYQRRSKPDLLLKQLLSPEPEVSSENNPLISDSKIYYTFDIDRDNLPISLRKEKGSCVTYPISQFASSNHRFLQHQSFIAAVECVRSYHMFKKH